MDVRKGAVSSLFPNLFELLFMDEYKLRKCAKKYLERLSGELKSMQLVLCKLGEFDDQVRIWADNAWELSYGIEKEVDDILVLMEQGKEFTKKMANLFKGKTRYQIAHTIRDIEQRVMEMSKMRNRDSNVAAILPGPPPIRALDTDERDLIGVEHARDELMQILCKGGNQLKVLSVVGSGGLGKSTLAKAVYDKIKCQFDCKAFVSVSRNPDMQKVFMRILYDLDKPNYLHNREKDEKQLIHETVKLLQTKRYLIVIDDLWDENIWDIILSSLPSNDCGSRVITTTRVNKIAENCCSENKDWIYKIMPLGYQNSRSLFLKRCFGSKDSCHESKIADALTEVDEILKICSGMPLAIISIASAIFPFSARTIKEQCQEVMTSLHSACGDLHCVQELTRILSYSYFDLPDALKPCLLYLGASAENQRIQRDNLVRKWIAEGLISEDKDRRKEVARRYFDELISRNMIQPVKYVNCEGKETYEVSYMMLYVLRLLLRNENFATILSESEPHVKVMPTRLFLQCSDSELSISTERVNLTNAYSVNVVGPANSVSFKHLKYVQVLDLDGCDDLHNSSMNDICLMIKLKYLSLKQTQVTEIPPEISNLQHLETLAIRNAQITTLPPQIGKLQNLETLDVSRTQISNLPPEISNLQNLETLDVSRTQISNLPPEIRKLQNLGTLDVSRTQISNLSPEIWNLQTLETLDVSRTQISNLPPEIRKLQNLRTLDVSRTQISNLPPEIRKLQNLRTLDVSRTQISNLPPEISNLQNLETLDVSWTQIRNLPPEIRKLQNLGTLDVSRTQVEELPKEVLQLPKLKHLHFGKSGCFGVKFPVGIYQLESVQVMGIVDSRACSGNAIKDIGEMPELLELEVVLYDGPDDMTRNDNLLASVGKCSKLKSLTIYGDSNPSNKLASESSNFFQLEKLKVAGRFVKVPGWIKQLSALTTLVIRVCKLEENDLEIIGGLPRLSVLELALVALPRKQVTITSSAGFTELEVFCFDCRVPWVSFEEKAMPNLKHLQLKLYSGPEGKHPSGIMLLERLNMVILQYSSQYAASVGVIETVAVVTRDAASHVNLIKLSISGDREVFPSHKSADRGVAGTEFDMSVNT